MSIVITGPTDWVNMQIYSLEGRFNCHKDYKALKTIATDRQFVIIGKTQAPQSSSDYYY